MSERTVLVTVTYEVEIIPSLRDDEIEAQIYVVELDIGPARADATHYEVEVVE